jgi:L-methionine (R)-S-oxide reductase
MNANDKAGLYRDLAAQLRSLIAGEPDRTANAANMAALIYHGLPDLNWAGFYFTQGGELVLGPFQGQPACVRIPGATASAAPPRRAAKPCWCPTCTTSPATSPATRSRDRSWSCR